MTCRRATKIPKGRHTKITVVVHTSQQHLALSLSLGLTYSTNTLKTCAKAYGYDHLAL